MKRILLALVLSAVSAGCASTMVYTHDVPNLVQVGPNVWRSGQPRSEAGWRYLATLGIKTDIKLNDTNEGSDQEAAIAGMNVVVLTITPEDDHPLSIFPEPDGARVKMAVATMETAAPGHGVLVHCTHGQDRTGLVVGEYRRKHDLWKKSTAWKEMLTNHFHVGLIGLVDYWMDN